MTSTKRPSRIAIPDRLWRVPVYLPYLQPALTERAIANAESTLRARLPRAYVAALRVQNGGYLRLREHPSGRAPVDCIAGIGSRYPSLLRHNLDDVKAHMEEEGIATPERIEELVPFCGDGHYYYCFDYRAGGRKREPRITYIDVETFDIDEVLAPDFGTFLGQLRPPETPMYGLMTHGKPGVVASALSKATGTRFEDLGDDTYGYPWFRAKLPGSDDFASLSANRTRRGFVRKSDVDYKTLRKLLPETVERYPQYPDCGYLLGCSSFASKGGQRLIRGLAKLPFGARALPADS